MRILGSTPLNRALSRRTSACIGTALMLWVGSAAGAAGFIRQPADEPPEMDMEKLRALLKEKMGQKAPEPADAQPADPHAKPPAANAKSAAEVQSEEALARFQQLLQRRPFHGPAFTALANHYAERGKLKDLIAEYTAKVAALPDDVAPRIVLARLLLRSGDGPGAAAMLEKVTAAGLPPELARQSGDLLVLKSEVYQKTGDNTAAERVLKEALAAAQGAPDKLRLGEALADLYVRSNRPEDAATSLKALAEQFPDNYIQQKHIAAALAQRNLHEAAVERYKAIVGGPLVKDDVERRTEVLRDMGAALEKLGEAHRAEAIAAYIEAVGLLASDHWMVPELHERIVGLYRASNKLEDLAAYCRAQIARAPEQTAMRVLLADVQAALGKPDEGKKTLADAVELFPKDAALSQKRVEFLERVGDVEGVAAEYQRAIGQRGDDSELYIAYGQFLANNKKLEGAKAQWKHVLETRLADPTLAVRLGGLFEAYELYDDAIGAYERAITIAPKQPEAYTALSRLWLSRGDPEKATAALTRMGEANPDDGTVQAARAQALRGLGQTEEALKAITRASELLPAEVRFHQMRAELLVQNGRLEEALEVRRSMLDRITNPVQQAEAIGTLVSMHASADRLPALKDAEEKRLAAKPGDAVSLLVLARVADAQRDFPAVKTRLEALLAVDPGNEAALGQMAKLQDATGDMDGAVETYTRLAQRYPARARQFYEAIVDLKLRYGDRAGAIGTLEKMAQNDAASAATLSAVGDQLVRMGDPERSLPYFEKALVAQADRHETRLNYGKALVDAGRLEDAMAAFRAVAIQRSDTDRAAEALGKLRDTATQLGRLEELIDELHRQVEADPQNTLVARALAQLLVGEMEYTRALELLDLIQKHNPRNAELALGRAEVLRRLARYDEAVEAYQRVLRFPQVDRDYVLGELGKAYFESGQVDQARRLWKQIQNKLYAGSLLKNNGILEEAISAFEEGIRLKPDEYALHRNLIEALEAAARASGVRPGVYWTLTPATCGMSSAWRRPTCGPTTARAPPPWRGGSSAPRWVRTSWGAAPAAARAQALSPRRCTSRPSSRTAGITAWAAAGRTWSAASSSSWGMD
jgi:tetratricopeptide (TPR) repeat protein